MERIFFKIGLTEIITEMFVGIWNPSELTKIISFVTKLAPGMEVVLCGQAFFLSLTPLLVSTMSSLWKCLRHRRGPLLPTLGGAWKGEDEALKK